MRTLASNYWFKNAAPVIKKICAEVIWKVYIQVYGKGLRKVCMRSQRAGVLVVGLVGT